MADYLRLYGSVSDLGSDSAITVTEGGKYSKLFSEYNGVDYKKDVDSIRFVKNEDTGEWWYNGDMRSDVPVEYLGDGVYCLSDANGCVPGKYTLHEAVVVSSVTYYRATAPDNTDYYLLPYTYDGRATRYGIYQNTGTTDNINLRSMWWNAYLIETFDKPALMTKPVPGVAYARNDKVVFFNGKTVGQGLVLSAQTETGNDLSWEDLGITEDLYHEIAAKCQDKTTLVEDLGIWFKFRNYAETPAVATRFELRTLKSTGDEYDIKLYRPGPRGYDSYNIMIKWRGNDGTVLKTVSIFYNSGLY